MFNQLSTAFQRLSDSAQSLYEQLYTANDIDIPLVDPKSIPPQQLEPTLLSLIPLLKTQIVSLTKPLIAAIRQLDPIPTEIQQALESVELYPLPVALSDTDIARIAPCLIPAMNEDLITDLLASAKLSPAAFNLKTHSEVMQLLRYEVRSQILGHELMPVVFSRVEADLADRLSQLTHDKTAARLKLATTDHTSATPEQQEQATREAVLRLWLGNTLDFLFKLGAHTFPAQASTTLLAAPLVKAIEDAQTALDSLTTELEPNAPAILRGHLTRSFDQTTYDTQYASVTRTVDAAVRYHKLISNLSSLSFGKFTDLQEMEDGATYSLEILSLQKIAIREQTLNPKALHGMTKTGLLEVLRRQKAAILEERKDFFDWLKTAVPEGRADFPVQRPEDNVTSDTLIAKLDETHVSELVERFLDECWIQPALLDKPELARAAMSHKSASTNVTRQWHIEKMMHVLDGAEAAKLFQRDTGLGASQHPKEFRKYQEALYAKELLDYQRLASSLGDSLLGARAPLSMAEGMMGKPLSELTVAEFGRDTYFAPTVRAAIAPLLQKEAASAATEDTFRTVAAISAFEHSMHERAQTEQSNDGEEEEKSLGLDKAGSLAPLLYETLTPAQLRRALTDFNLPRHCEEASELAVKCEDIDPSSLPGYQSLQSRSEETHPLADLNLTEIIEVGLPLSGLRKKENTYQAMMASLFIAGLVGDNNTPATLRHVIAHRTLTRELVKLQARQSTLDIDTIKAELTRLNQLQLSFLSEEVFQPRIDDLLGEIRHTAQVETESLRTPPRPSRRPPATAKDDAPTAGASPSKTMAVATALLSLTLKQGDAPAYAEDLILTMLDSETFEQHVEEVVDSAINRQKLTHVLSQSCLRELHARGLTRYFSLDALPEAGELLRLVSQTPGEKPSVQLHELSFLRRWFQAEMGSAQLPEVASRALELPVVNGLLLQLLLTGYDDGKLSTLISASTDDEALAQNLVTRMINFRENWLKLKGEIGTKALMAYQAAQATIADSSKLNQILRYQQRYTAFLKYLRDIKATLSQKGTVTKTMRASLNEQVRELFLSENMAVETMALTEQNPGLARPRRSSSSRDLLLVDLPEDISELHDKLQQSLVSLSFYPIPETESGRAEEEYKDGIVTPSRLQDLIEKIRTLVPADATSSAMKELVLPEDSLIILQGMDPAGLRHSLSEALAQFDRVFATSPTFLPHLCEAAANYHLDVTEFAKLSSEQLLELAFNKPEYKAPSDAYRHRRHLAARQVIERISSIKRVNGYSIPMEHLGGLDALAIAQQMIKARELIYALEVVKAASADPSRIDSDRKVPLAFITTSAAFDSQGFGTTLQRLEESSTEAELEDDAPAAEAQASLLKYTALTASLANRTRVEDRDRETTAFDVNTYDLTLAEKYLAHDPFAIDVSEQIILSRNSDDDTVSSLRAADNPSVLDQIQNQVKQLARSFYTELAFSLACSEEEVNTDALQLRATIAEYNQKAGTVSLVTELVDKKDNALFARLHTTLRVDAVKSAAGHTLLVPRQGIRHSSKVFHPLPQGSVYARSRYVTQPKRGLLVRLLRWFTTPLRNLWKRYQKSRANIPATKTSTLADHAKVACAIHAGLLTDGDAKTVEAIKAKQLNIRKSCLVSVLPSPIAAVDKTPPVIAIQAEKEISGIHADIEHRAPAIASDDSGSDSDDSTSDVDEAEQTAADVNSNEAALSAKIHAPGLAARPSAVGQ